MALAADLSREEHRIKMMALIGVSIGMSFALSMVLGPMVNGWIGISGIFYGTAVLALVGIAILFLLVPDPAESHFHRDAEVEAQPGQRDDAQRGQQQDRDDDLPAVFRELQDLSE